MDNNNDRPDDTYTVQELAKRLDVSTGWFKNNRRKKKDALPSIRVGYRTIRFIKQEIFRLFGLNDSTLYFYSPKHLAERINVSERWLKANRKSADPIPFIRIGWLIRYPKVEVDKWLETHTIKPTDYDE